MKSDKGRLVKEKNEVTIRIDGIDFSLQHLWMRDRVPMSGKVAKGVIFLVPIFNVSDHWNAWTRMVKALDPMPEKVIFCENNSTDNTLELISNWDFPHEVIRIWVKPNANRDVGNMYGVIAHVRELLLTRARCFDAEYAIFIDDDIYPERMDFIDILRSKKVDICGGAYMRPLEEGPSFETTWVLDSRWSVFQPIEEMPIVAPTREEAEKKLKEYKGAYISFVNIEKDRLYRVAATGGGLIGLSKKVIRDRTVFFYPMHGSESEDFGFCLCAEVSGYKIYLASDVKCSHVLSSSKPRMWKP
jgi:glycosyltransferase involved in cell wall biosynthesis